MIDLIKLQKKMDKLINSKTFIKDFKKFIQKQNKLPRFIKYGKTIR